MIINWIHFFSSIWMTSLIWFVQIVHYPLFLAVSSQNLTLYCKQHQYLISFIVVPVMIIECITLIYIIMNAPNSKLWIICAFLLLIIWLSTFFIQVPLHHTLSQKATIEVINKLIYTNWIRTICWSIKTILIVFIIKNKF